VRPDVRMFLDALKANPRPALTAENIAAMRLMAPQGMALLEPPIGELALVRDIKMPGPDGEIPLRLFKSLA
jgi:acetyl esterase